MTVSTWVTSNATMEILPVETAAVLCAQLKQDGLVLEVQLVLLILAKRYVVMAGTTDTRNVMMETLLTETDVAHPAISRKGGAALEEILTSQTAAALFAETALTLVRSVMMATLLTVMDAHLLATLRKDGAAQEEALQDQTCATTSVQMEMS